MLRVERRSGFGRHGTPGEVYIFQRSGQSWIEQAKLAPSDLHIQSFGLAVAIQGTTLLVGAANGQMVEGTFVPGVAYVYENQGTWTEQAKLIPMDRLPLDEFGTSVALDHGTAVVGAPGAAGLNGQR